MEITNLKRIRTAKNISQSKLAELSNVNVRLIQDYEQGHKQINNAMAITLYNLAIPLNCTIEELLDK